MDESGINLNFDLDELDEYRLFEIVKSDIVDEVLSQITNSDIQNFDFYELRSKVVPLSVSLAESPTIKTEVAKSRTQFKQQLMRDQELQKEQLKRKKAEEEAKANKRNAEPIQIPVNIHNVELPQHVLQVTSVLKNPTKYHILAKQKNQVLQYLNASQPDEYFLKKIEACASSVQEKKQMRLLQQREAELQRQQQEAEILRQQREAELLRQQQEAELLRQQHRTELYRPQEPKKEKQERKKEEQKQQQPKPPISPQKQKPKSLEVHQNYPPTTPAPVITVPSPEVLSPVIGSVPTSGNTSDAEEVLEGILSYETNPYVDEFGNVQSKSLFGPGRSEIPKNNSNSCPSGLQQCKQEFQAFGELDTKDRIKKDNHNIIERRRRCNINDRIKELGELLPKTNDPHYDLVRDNRLNKGTILKSSVDYIKVLKHDIQKLKQIELDNKQLQAQNRKLLLRIQELERQAKENTMSVKDVTWNIVKPPTLFTSVLKNEWEGKKKIEPKTKCKTNYSQCDLMDQDPEKDAMC